MSINRDLQNIMIINKSLADWIQETNEETVFKESQLYSEMERCASELIWDLYKLLWIAKSKYNSFSFNLKDNEENYFVDSNEKYIESSSQNSEEELKINNENSKENDILLNKHSEIDISYVNFKHSFKSKEFNELPMQLQILLLWPSQTFANIYNCFTEMKLSKNYKKTLFKDLENNTNIVLKDNFFKEYISENLWNQRYNKIINDWNQYLLNKEDTNIFISILKQNDAIRYFLLKLTKYSKFKILF